MTTDAKKSLPFGATAECPGELRERGASQRGLRRSPVLGQRMSTTVPPRTSKPAYPVSQSAARLFNRWAWATGH